VTSRLLFSGFNLCFPGLFMFIVLDMLYINSSHVIWFDTDVLEGEIFLQNLPSIVTAHALGTYYCFRFFI
jgi:hypothetical protein